MRSCDTVVNLLLYNVSLVLFNFFSSAIVIRIYVLMCGIVDHKNNEIISGYFPHCTSSFIRELQYFVHIPIVLCVLWLEKQKNIHK